jgi:hypothetical protein
MTERTGLLGALSEALVIDLADEDWEVQSPELMRERLRAIEADAAARGGLTVERLREVLREIPSIDWTAQDDLTRYATAVVDALAHAGSGS